MIDYKVLLVRAAKTFAQAFLASFGLGLANVTNVTALKALAVAGVAAGISAVMNLVVKPTEAR